MSGMKMLIFVAFTMLLRPHYASTTIPLRLYHVLTALILRPHYDHTTSYPIATQSYHASTAIIARFYCDYTTFIPRSYYVLSNNVNILFHIKTVPFLIFSLVRRFIGNNTVVAPKSTRRRGRGGRSRCRGKGSSNSNES